MASIIRWLFQITIAIDQLLNAILFGSPDETLSARAYRVEQKGLIFGKLFRPLIDTILFFDKNHCYNSYLSEIHRRQFPKDYQ